MSGYKLVLEVEGVEAGTFKKDNMGEPRAYLRVWGKASSNGRWAKSVCYGETALAFQEALAAGTAPGEDPADRRPIVELGGQWDERIRETADGPKKDRSFKVEKFQILSGPSVELEKTRRLSVSALKSAERELKAGDITQAYKVLEAFVARVARLPQPSVEMEGADLGEVASVGNGPEEAGLARFDEMERRRSGAAPMASAVEPKAEAAVESVAPQVTEASRPVEQADEIAAEPSPGIPEEAAPAIDVSVEPVAAVEPTQAAESVAEAEPAPVAEAAAETPAIAAEDAAAAPADDVLFDEGAPAIEETAQVSQMAEEPAETVAAAAEPTPEEKPAVAAEAKPVAVPPKAPVVAGRPTLPIRPALPPRPGIRPALPPRTAPASTPSVAKDASPKQDAAPATQASAPSKATAPAAPAAPATAAARSFPRVMQRIPPRVGVSKPAPVAAQEPEAENEPAGPQP